MKDKVIQFLGVDTHQIIKDDKKIDTYNLKVPFISLKSILPNTKNFLKQDGDIITLVKPFFGCDLRRTSKFIIVQNSSFHNRVLVDLIGLCIEIQFNPSGIIRSLY